MKSGNLVGRPFSVYCLMLLAMVMAFTACNDDQADPKIEAPIGTLNVMNQNMNSGTITVAQVVLDKNGWVVIHRGVEAGGPMVPNIISEPAFVQAGTQTNVMVDLKEGESIGVNEQVYVMLHTDTGQEEVYEFNGGDTPDQPILDSNGSIVMTAVTNVGPSGSASVSNQFIAETDNMFVVDEVTLEEAGWVVVHGVTTEGGPVVPGIISEPKYLEAGTYTDVMVALKEGEEIAADETFFVMLHDDTDKDKVYSFTGAADSEDIPLFNAGNMVMVSAMNSYTFTDDTENTMYPLTEVNGSGMYGTATLYRAARGNGAYVVLDLEGTAEGEAFPAHIHQGVAGSNGAVVVSLSDVTGAEGESVTFVSTMDDGTPITYDNLLAYDGYVNVHGAQLLATGNIGANGSALTGETKEYSLSEMGVPGVSGTATLWALEEGTLIQLMLDGTAEGDMHPAHIHMNTAAESGDIVVSLESVNGKSGQSFTFVNGLDNGTPLTYAELLDFNGYINVHNSIDDLGTLAAQGDIGQNELTGEMMEYALAAGNETTGIPGTVSFMQRKNGNTLVKIAMEGDLTDGEMYASHIHDGMVGDNGAVAISLNPVDGTTNMSMTSVRMKNDETPMTYEELLGYSGYVNVHDFADLGILVSTGNIGASAE
jgi:hypothetical protein